MYIQEYAKKHQVRVKKFVSERHEECGFAYDPRLDYDLEDPRGYYIEAGGAFYLLVHERRVVGTVAVRKIDQKTAELKRLYIHPMHRECGFGGQLLRKALEFCEAKGFSSCRLNTDTAQPAAYRLYVKHGFEVTKRSGSTVFMCKQFA